MAVKRKKAVSTSGHSIPEWALIDPDSKPITVAGVKRDYDRLLWEAEFYIHYEISPKVLGTAFVKYCGKHFDTKQAAKLKKLPDYHYSVIGKYAYIENKGGKLSDALTERLEEHYNKFIAMADIVIANETQDQELEAAKPKAPVVSIQQRMREQVMDLVGEWEHHLDIIVSGELRIDRFEPYNDMMSYEPAIKPAHAKIIRDQFVAGHEEAQLVVTWKDDDIKEGYSMLDTPKKRKAFLEFYERIFTACDTIINTGKATRKTRAKKAPSKDKLIAKLKYKESDPNTGMASINPISIIESKMLWVFNTKNRKLGIYVADELTGPLSVKGTTVIGFDPTKSVQKTVRKPEVLLKGAGKLARTKMQKLFDGINSTDTKLNGRLNEHTILIKVF